MHVRIAASLIGSLLVTAAIGATSASQPTTAPTTQLSALDEPTLARGRAIRQALLDTLEAAYANGGQWPAALVDVVPGTQVIYTPPPATPTSQPADAMEAFRARAIAGTRVVVEESLAEHPAGIWIGFASGRVEFAEDDAARLRCEASVSILERAPTPMQRFDQPHDATGTLRLRVLDAGGHPVAASHVGVFRNSGDRPHVTMDLCFAVDHQPSSVTGADGRIELAAANVFAAKFSIVPTAPLFVEDGSHQLMAELDLTRDDFHEPPGAERTVRLAPACLVIGRTTCLDRPDAGASTTWQNTVVWRPIDRSFYTLESINGSQRFSLLLPPGDWAVETYNGGGATQYVHIEPGQRELHLRPDLPLSMTDRLVGQPAPDLQQIKAWKNGGPTTLAQLRGQVVLLDFWGYWCGPCCGAMPALMKLHDDYHDKGLTIIAVHNDTADSIADMDAKLAKTRAELWGGRDLPFLVALDGGGETRIRYSMTFADGATTAAYGITGFPTTLLIGRYGRVITAINPDSDGARAEIEKALAEPTPQ